MGSEDENPPRDGTRRGKRSTRHSYSVYLYTRHTNKFVKVTEKKIDALAPNKKDKYAELILTQLGFKGEHSIKGKESQKFICMNSTGHIILKNTYTKRECMFYKVPHKKGYVTFRLVDNSKWHLGFKKRGEIKHGHRTEHDHHAAWMIEMEPE